MKNYRSNEEKFELSPLMESEYAVVRARMKDWDAREMTRTGPEPDGKEPFLEAFESMPDEPYIICLAQGIADSWTESPVLLDEDDILCGYQRPRRLLFEHFAWGIEYDTYPFSYSDVYKGREEEMKARIERQKERMFPMDFEHLEAEGRRMFGRELYEKMEGLWSPGGYQGHTVPDYFRLLDRGIGGMLEEVRKYAANTADQKKLDLYRAMEIILYGMEKHMLIYAEAAEKKAAGCGGEKAERFRAIAANCRKVSHDKPETLYQAAQLVWFFSLWDWVDCVGRLDQYLWRFYEKSLACGDLFSCEDIMTSLIFKFMEHGVHNIPLGGVKPEDGTDATNDLSFMVLQICRALHTTHPRLVARIHRNSPGEFMALVVKMWSEGMSDPTLASDELIIEGLRGYGVSLEDARSYATLGCQEIEIPGKSNFGCEDGLFNLAKVFEYTINDGADRFTGLQCGLHTGRLCDFGSMDDLWDAFIKQMKYFTERFIILCNKGQEIRAANVSKLVKSIFTDDCIARGLHLDEGGSVYNYGVVETAGSSAVADSMAAIDKLMFTEKAISPETLEAAIAADFEGYEKERQMLLAAPKFGNDEPLADGYAARILDAFWTEIGKYRSVRGGVFTGACSLLSGGIHYGRMTWAMPDGRHKGEELGNTIGPRTGADKDGLTAMLNSVEKLPLKKGIGGTTVNVLIPTEITKTREEREKIEALMTAYMLNGGQMAQITTANRDEMIDAQSHPENHENLIVRVGGFSTRFIEMGRSGQNEVIKRYS
ncbi:MAG: hypothetical protein IJR90_04050 [Clostridia bacterium]|nr:hypothetical protein [Clostridia bacterium]